MWLVDATIVNILDCTDKTATKWRRRFAAQGLAGRMRSLGRGGRGRFPPPRSRRSRRWRANCRRSADEKAGLQALARRHQLVTPGTGRPASRSYE
jgi:hypothetical protein